MEDVLKEFEGREKADAEDGNGELVNGNDDSIHESVGGQTNRAPAEDLEEGEVETETEDQLPASHVSISFFKHQWSNSFHLLINNLPHTIQTTSLAHPPHVNHADEKNAMDQPNAGSDMPQMGFSSG